MAPSGFAPQGVSNSSSNSIFTGGAFPASSSSTMPSNSRKRRMADENAAPAVNFATSDENRTNAPSAKRVCTGFAPSATAANPLPDITNVIPLPDAADRIGRSQHPQRSSRKRARSPAGDEVCSPRHKSAKVALFSILGEAGMLAAESEQTPSKQVPMETMDGQLADPHQIVLYKDNARALVQGSNHPQHLERLATLMSDPMLIKQLYEEFCSRIARPVDITNAWKYFVQELSKYIHSQCQASGRRDVTYDQIEGFIKANWFTITHANSKALTGQEYVEVFPSSQDGAIVLSNSQGSTNGDAPRCQDLDVDMDISDSEF